MRPLAFIFACAMVICFTSPSHAQIPNGSFEDWTGGEPDDWSTDNDVLPGLITETAGYNGPGALLTEQAGHDTLFWLGMNSGYFPLDKREAFISLYYKCNFLEGLSDHSVQVLLYVYDQSYTEIGIAVYSFFFGDNTDEWTEKTLPITYWLPHDAAWGSCDVHMHGEVPWGSWFAIDELSLSAAVTNPAAGDHWISGEADTIRWVA